MVKGRYTDCRLICSQVIQGIVIKNIHFVSIYFSGCRTVCRDDMMFGTWIFYGIGSKVKWLTTIEFSKLRLKWQNFEISNGSTIFLLSRSDLHSKRYTYWKIRNILIKILIMRWHASNNIVSYYYDILLHCSWRYVTLIACLQKNNKLCLSRYC